FICKAIIYSRSHSVKALRKIAQFSRVIFIKNVWSSPLPVLDIGFETMLFYPCKTERYLGSDGLCRRNCRCSSPQGRVSGAPRGSSYLLLPTVWAYSILFKVWVRPFLFY